MRSRIKLITPDDFKELSGIVGSFDFDFIAPFVYIAQDIDLSERIGEAMLNRILEGHANVNLNAFEQALLDSYIVPSVVQWAVSRGLTNMLFKYDNSGVVKRSSENGQAAELLEVSFMSDQAKILAESYGKRLRDFIEANYTNYPEFATEVMGQIKPEQTPSFTGGMWLGKKSCGNITLSGGGGGVTPPVPTDKISALHVQGYSGPVPINTEITPTLIWTSVGAPTGMEITDPDGVIYPVPDGATTFDINKIFNSTAGAATMVFTLASTNAGVITTSISWDYAVFTGSTDDVTDTVDEVEILANGIQAMIPYSPELSIQMDAANQYSYIAVPKMATKYVAWYEHVLNNGGIGQHEFFRYQGTIVIATYDYDVYITNYPTNLDGIIKFS